MASLSYTYCYRYYDVMIIGYQLPGGGRLAMEVRWGRGLNCFAIPKIFIRTSIASAAWEYGRRIR